MKYLVFDITNLLYRTFFAHKSEDDVTIAGMAHHMALMTLNKYFKYYKPHKVIMCFDRSSWRKEYTKSDECVSGKVYKGHRRKKMSPSQKEKYEAFLDHIAEFEEIMKVHTSAVVLAGEGLEADDLISGCVDVLMTMDEDNEIIIVSSDKDMIQCLRSPNVSLVNPADGKERTLDDWDGDVDLFLFEKCIRGDTGDNVQSSLPRCKKTRILRAYNDELEKANLMHETWTAPDGKEFVVKHLFKENELLMDLNKQPEYIQKRIIKTVLEGLKDPGTYSHFHFLKFLGKYEMKKVTEQLEQFVPMLSR